MSLKKDHPFVYCALWMIPGVVGALGLLFLVLASAYAQLAQQENTAARYQHSPAPTARATFPPVH